MLWSKGYFSDELIGFPEKIWRRGQEILYRVASVYDKVDIGLIRPSPRQLRKKFQAIDELAQSIETHGLLQPIVVRIIPDGFEIVAGHRRFEACKLLHWRKIPCYVSELTEKEAFEASLVENIQRGALNPLEEAEAYRKFVDDYGWGGVSDLAKRIGKSEEYVSHRILLLSLPEEVKERLIRNEISPSVTRELLSLDKETDQIYFAEMAASSHLSSRMVRQFVKIVREGSSTEEALSGPGEKDPFAMWDQRDLYLERRQATTLRILKQMIVSLRLTLMRIDALLDEIDDNRWILRDILMHERVELHRQIDTFVRMKCRVEGRIKR
ncbi:MAG: ParB/RepB/Spo0J family partition protein [Thaumarchaeota archaeon]|nr:ParB/RepB/Spo0J family partition protein [Nitrososphaerota archaeon]